MRGDPKDEAQKIIHDAAIQAKVVLTQAEIKAEKRRFASTAVILGPDNEPLFHIVSTWWSRMVVIGYGALLGVVVLMTLLIYLNKAQLDALEQKVDQDQQTIGP